LVKRVLLASPRGYCAGVERAIDTVEQALARWGPPIYVRKQIVHNAYVVSELEGRGAVFVESEEDVPEGATVIFSAHGVAPAVHERARSRGLHTIDATCPLVTKVHAEARAFASLGYTILLIGHMGHEEIEGTHGVAPEQTMVVQSAAEAELVVPPQSERLAYLTQTTLSVDETAGIVAVLRRRFPSIEGPRKDDICYATANRQRAVKSLLPQVELVLVIGSRNSSNSKRLVEVARTGGVMAYLIDDESDIDERWLDRVETVGLTSGASAPERLVRSVCAWFRARGVADIRPHGSGREDVYFKLPPLAGNLPRAAYGPDELGPHHPAGPAPATPPPSGSPTGITHRPLQPAR
jgi:4-hydroxy-3-methylbut-2-enyl diphosphate reductase